MHCLDLGVGAPVWIRNVGPTSAARLMAWKATRKEPHQSDSADHRGENQIIRNYVLYCN